MDSKEQLPLPQQRDTTFFKQSSSASMIRTMDNDVTITDIDDLDIHPMQRVPSKHTLRMSNSLSIPKLTSLSDKPMNPTSMLASPPLSPPTPTMLESSLTNDTSTTTPIQENTKLKQSLSSAHQITELPSTASNIPPASQTEMSSKSNVDSNLSTNLTLPEKNPSSQASLPLTPSSSMKLEKDATCPQIKIPETKEPNKMTFEEMIQWNLNYSHSLKRKSLIRQFKALSNPHVLGVYNGKKIESKVNTWGSSSSKKSSFSEAEKDSAPSNATVMTPPLSISSSSTASAKKARESKSVINVQTPASPTSPTTPTIASTRKPKPNRSSIKPPTTIKHNTQAYQGKMELSNAKTNTKPTTTITKTKATSNNSLQSSSKQTSIQLTSSIPISSNKYATVPSKVKTYIQSPTTSPNASQRSIQDTNKSTFPRKSQEKNLNKEKKMAPVFKFPSQLKPKPKDSNAHQVKSNENIIVANQKTNKSEMKNVQPLLYSTKMSLTTTPSLIRPPTSFVPTENLAPSDLFMGITSNFIPLKQREKSLFVLKKETAKPNPQGVENNKPLTSITPVLVKNSSSTTSSLLSDITLKPQSSFASKESISSTLTKTASSINTSPLSSSSFSSIPSVSSILTEITPVIVPTTMVSPQTPTKPTLKNSNGFLYPTVASLLKSKDVTSPEEESYNDARNFFTIRPQRRKSSISSPISSPSSTIPRTATLRKSSVTASPESMSQKRNSMDPTSESQVHLNSRQVQVDKLEDTLEDPLEILSKVQAIVQPPSDLIYLSLLLIYILISYDFILGML